MVGDFNRGALLRPAALILAAILGGCGQVSGLSGISLLGNSQDTAEVNPEAQVQLAALSPAETPPLPTRRPGKRPPALRGQPGNAAAKGAQTASTAKPDQTASTAKPEQTASAAKPEDSGLSLASLSNINLFSGGGDAGGPDRVLIEQKPIDAYSLLAQRIKYCWLNPSAARLPNHGFYSDVPAGEVKEVKMVVYEKSEDGRRGNTVFKVDISAELSGALVVAQNVRLDKALDQSFKSDLARWAKGDERCKL